MGLMSSQTSVAINTTSPNVLAGLMEEFVTRPSIVRVYCNGARSLISETVLAGGGVAVDDQDISERNAALVKPDDELYTFGVNPGVGGDRLMLRFRNRNVAAGPDIVRWQVEIQPIA